MGRPRKEPLTTEEQQELEDKLNEANAKLAATVPDKPSIDKPYTKTEIDEHATTGTVIGNPRQKLVTGHNEADLQEWEMWKCELKLRGAMVLPETGQSWSTPAEIIPTKLEKPSMRANDKTFQTMNKQINFRELREGQIFYYFPKGTIEPSKKYQCGYWVEVLNKGRADEQRLVHIDVIGNDRVTGKPANWREKL